MTGTTFDLGSDAGSDTRGGTGFGAGFDMVAAFGEIADLLVDVDAGPDADGSMLRDLAGLARRYVTGADDADEVDDFLAAGRGELEAVTRIAGANPRLDFARYADLDPCGVFGEIAPARRPLARLVMARRMAIDLDASHALAFPDVRSLLRECRRDDEGEAGVVATGWAGAGPTTAGRP